MARPLNVLLIISDQHKQTVSGCYGDPLVRTPNLDRLARDGVVFDNAFCQAPVCGPSRASIVTGTYPQTSGVYSHYQPDPVRYLPTLGHVFRSEGYRTAAIGKLHVHGEDRRYRDLGFDDRQLRFYTYDYEDYIQLVGLDNVRRYTSDRDLGDHPGRRPYFNPTNEPVTLDDALMYDHLVVDRCIDFMAGHRDRPFLLWAGLEKPHPDWYAPARFHAMYRPDDFSIPETFHCDTRLPATAERCRRSGRRFPPEHIPCCMAAYYANVSYLDEQIGRLLQCVEDQGLADNTVVVYTSDHGEHLFEHGMIEKHCFFDSATKVPLIVRHPRGWSAGRRSEALVELIDLVPTLADLCAVQAPPTLEGRSLGPLLENPKQAHKSEVFSEFYEAGAAERMIRTATHKFVHTVGDIHQLYDLEKDPQETRNLADDRAYADIAHALETQLLATWRQPPAHCVPPPRRPG